MKHIRQKNSVDKTYTVVITTNWDDDDLVNHPSIVENPDLFEISESDIPSDMQFLKYQ